MIGDAALVPPNTFQPPAWESYVATPVAGSATAETSATVRLEQPVSSCQDGLGSYAEQPEPAPAMPLGVTVPHHTDSVQPRELLALVRVVPPTAVTYCEAAGYSTPYPASPELTVMATPGWLKYWLSAAVSLGSSEPP